MMTPNDSIAQRNLIELFAQCNTCIDDRPSGMTPQEWGTLDVGLTKDKMHIQLWCRRCDKNVAVFTLDDTINAGCNCCDE